MHFIIFYGQGSKQTCSPEKKKNALRNSGLGKESFFEGLMFRGLETWRTGWHEREPLPVGASRLFNA
jgi:hypothetical protein